MKRDWFQIASNTAVIVGLVVLIYEVRLSNFHAELEIQAANWDMWTGRTVAVLGEAPSTVLAKAVDNPDELTLDELMVVDAFHQNALAEIWHNGYYDQLGVGVPEWQYNVRAVARETLGYPLGRKWWSLYRVIVDENVRDVVDQALEENPDYRVQHFRALQDGSD